MGPLVPLLFLIPIFLGAAWLFDEIAVVRGGPILTIVFALATLWIPFVYLRHHNWFAKNDSDRLQSEEYRAGMARIQMIAAKELPYPIPADRLSLADPTENPSQHQTRTEDEESPDSIVAEEEKAQ